MVPEIKVQIIFTGNVKGARKAHDLTTTAIKNITKLAYNVAGEG